MAKPRQSLTSAQLPWLVGFALFLIVGWMTELLIRTELESKELVRKIELHEELYAVRDKLDRSLLNILNLAVGISAYVEAHNGKVDDDEIARLLKALYGHSKHVRNFGLAEGTTIRYVFPLAGNEAAIGKNYREIAGQWPGVLVAMNSPEGVLTGPVDLIQGGRALIYRIPIVTDGQYWGLFNIVIHMDTFLQEIAASRLITKGHLAIRAHHEDHRVMLLGEESYFDASDAQMVDVGVPGGYWELVMEPKKLEPSFAMVWRFFGWAIAILLGGGIGTILAQRSALQGLALIDELTGVANRRQFDLMLERFCQKYERRDSGCFALLYVDLDRFKAINDNHGHRAGDFYLIELARRIKQAIRGGDVFARWGGDEFAILLDNPSQASIDHVVKRVQELAEQPVMWRDTELQLGASIGVVKFPEDGTTSESLLGIADQKMYHNKKKRREQA